LGWGERLTGGARGEEAAAGVIAAPRVGDAGGGAGWAGSWAQSGGGAGGGGRYRRPTARGGRGEGRGGEAGWASRPARPRAKGGGAAGPKKGRRGRGEKRKDFLFLISIFYMNAFTLSNNQKNAWCSKPKKITLGFTIVT
jgi:hypothetical protein